MPMMPTSAPRQAPYAPQLSPPTPAEADGPLNLSKPKGSSGSRGSGGGGVGRGCDVMMSNGDRSPTLHQNQSSDSSSRNSVPPGLVLPSTFMPFATFPLPSGKLFGSYIHTLNGDNNCNNWGINFFFRKWKQGPTFPFLSNASPKFHESGENWTVLTLVWLRHEWKQSRWRYDWLWRSQ